MALGPLTPDNRPDDPRIEHRMIDRAHHQGNAGRAGRTRDSAPEDFDKALRKKLRANEAEDTELNSDCCQDDPNTSLRADQEQPPEGTTAADIDRESQKQGQEEAEKMGGGGVLRGPNPLLGLAVMPGVNLLQGVAVTRGESTRSDDETTAVQEVSAAEARVDPSILTGLVEAGLSRPLSGLDDPRLAGARPDLGDELWRSGPVPGGVAYHWENISTGAYQRLEWSDARTLLESAVGTTLQILERKAGQIFSRRRTRPDPDRKNFKVADPPEPNMGG